MDARHLGCKPIEALRRQRDRVRVVSPQRVLEVYPRAENALGARGVDIVAEEHGVVTVTVAAKDNPAESATFDGEISFDGLTERTWVNSDNANSGQTWAAKSINARLSAGRSPSAPSGPPGDVKKAA